MNKFDSQQQAHSTAALCIGRIVNLGSRPFQEGDVEKYEDAKSIFLDAMDFLGVTDKTIAPNFFADSKKILLSGDE